MSTNSLSPRIVAVWAVFLGAVAGAAISVAVLIRDFCSRYHAIAPNYTNYGTDYYAETARLAMAGIFLLVPVAIAAAFALRRSGIERTWVFRWSLFAAALAAFACFLWHFAHVLQVLLGGEYAVALLAESGASALIALVVSLGCAFVLSGKASRMPRVTAGIGIVIAVLTLAIAVIGFFLIGTPTQIRDFRHDDQRTSDLGSLQSAVESYWFEHQALPDDIPSLELPDPGYNISDPLGTPYVYERLTPTTYNLCATFGQDWDLEQARGVQPLTDWKHEAGYYCFAKTTEGLEEQGY